MINLILHMVEKVCEEWKNSFKLFLLWCAKNGYKNGLYLIRIDKNKNFEPNNCAFSTTY